MSSDPVVTALQTPGHLQFPENFPFKDNFDRVGGRVVRQETGHLVFYRSDGRRFLATDPSGHPLHECDWSSDHNRQVKLARARIRLDWGAWIGLKPSGLVNETELNLATKPGWQRLTADDLRNMAAQALGVPFDDVRWFFRDEDLIIGPAGRARIRHRKDALYVLEDLDFGQARFMSCMGAMHWESIDFLPVVELFKSLLPGTGSAVFELIRELYDDQHQGQSPDSLRYRGIPPYPSEAAFRLFSSFFVPHAPPGQDACTLFMDPAKASRVQWFPSPTPPRRYFDMTVGSCMTVQGGVLQKVTLENDSAGLPYTNPTGKVIPWDRAVRVVDGQILIRDREQETAVSTLLPDGCCEESLSAVTMSPVGWRSLFPQGVPSIAPRDAYGAVVLYPDDDREIDEVATQPFVADYIQDVMEQDREMGAIIARAERIAIRNGDAVIATCIAFDRPRDYIVRVRLPAFAQKQAQQLWHICAQLQRWDWLKRIRFIPIGQGLGDPPSTNVFDVVYHWMPFTIADDDQLLLSAAKELRQELRAAGHAFVAGPGRLSECWGRAGFRLLWQEPVEQLPTFRTHRTILPSARLRPGLMLCCIRAV